MLDLLPKPLHALRGSETILVVDDTEAFRHVVVRLLEILGYRVLAVEGAAAALEVLAQNPDVSLLLTDVRMPGTCGPELASQVAERAPACRVMFMTGYGVGHIEGCDPGAVLEKPFSHALLARRVRDRLDS